MRVFEGPAEFVSFLDENPDIIEIIPWAQDLINFHKNVHKGCKCKEKVRAQHRDNSYKDMAINIIGMSRPLQGVLSEKIGAFDPNTGLSEGVQFKLHGEILLEF